MGGCLQRASSSSQPRKELWKATIYMEHKSPSKAQFFFCGDVVKMQMV